MSAASAPTGASIWTVVEYQVRLARSFWRSILIVGVATPLLYVLALGVGLGTVVNRNGTGELGVPYLVFVAPAFLTAAALQIGAADASFPLMGGFKWARTFHGMAATPLSPAQICDGQLTWIAIRLFANSAVYLAIMAMFGAARSPWILLAVPIATLTGIAFAAPVAAFVATIEREGNGLNVIFRFVVTPMFLFSGTFYPISQLPQWGQWLAWVSPLWHGTELARDSALGGGLSLLAVLGHLLYLVLWFVVGLQLARWRFRVRLTK
ncbi:MAG: transporter permease [Jatrophihabitans sp.]|jgi:lipooligosaccharide transport system permease protein|nr:transporter permease [Jatrophihabitans sp.]MCW2656520.1 transporter permease [Jatrophihabitans sp.]MDT4903612.1 lipooligosaccharide transport system permease protein [Pseudonocardiales bacterium]MDT4927443.1 lipooligosaccharide transport system permease protein [Pseudonocardiales bacterium]MDT4951149.1 lipooligosaccharide transport system permease protein [Pseudonocardiales bacterium]